MKRWGILGSLMAIAMAVTALVLAIGLDQQVEAARKIKGLGDGGYTVVCAKYKVGLDADGKVVTVARPKDGTEFLLENVLVGGEGSDVLQARWGSADPWLIIGLGGDDTLKGAGGDDIICGGDGNDAIAGEFGNDTLYGDAGCDSVHGGAGDDTIYGGNDNDAGPTGGCLLAGSPSGWQVIGGLFGNDGNDLILGGKGNDYHDGGDGFDHCKGGPGGKDGADNCEKLSTIENAPWPH